VNGFFVVIWGGGEGLFSWCVFGVSFFCVFGGELCACFYMYDFVGFNNVMHQFCSA